MDLLRRLEKTKDSWYLIGICFLFFLLRYPSLFEPYWYGDEGIYHTVARAIRAGRLLYEGIWDNKPPLLYYVYAIFNSDQFYIRLFSLICGLGAVIAFYFLAKKLLKRSSVTLFSTGIFAVLFGLPLLEGTIANAENFMLLPILVAANLVFQSEEAIKKLTHFKEIVTKDGTLFAAGFLVGIAFLFKAVAVFDAIAFILFIFIIDVKKKSFSAFINNCISFGIGFLMPFAFTIIYFFLQGNLKEFMSAAFIQSAGYVGYENSFIIPQGLLIIKSILVALIVAGLVIKRNSIDKSAIFLVLWTTFSVYNAFFSARPYTHYLLVLLPSFCLLIGYFLDDIRKRFIVGILLIIIIFTIDKNFWIYRRIIPYYQNFVAYVTNQKDITAYRAYFDKNTPNDYLVADFLKQHLTDHDNVLIWGNNAQLYTMINKIPPSRFTVAYHMSFSPNAREETQQAVKKANPKFIVIMPRQDNPPIQLLNYRLRYTINNIIIYERY